MMESNNNNYYFILRVCAVVIVVVETNESLAYRAGICVVANVCQRIMF